MTRVPPRPEPRQTCSADEFVALREEKRKHGLIPKKYKPKKSKEPDVDDEERMMAHLIQSFKQHKEQSHEPD